MPTAVLPHPWAEFSTILCKPLTDISSWYLRRLYPPCLLTNSVYKREYMCVLITKQEKKKNYVHPFYIHALYYCLSFTQNSSRNGTLSFSLEQDICSGFQRCVQEISGKPATLPRDSFIQSLRASMVTWMSFASTIIQL